MNDIAMKKLAHDSINCFFKQFDTTDDYNRMVIEILFEIILFNNFNKNLGNTKGS